MNTGKHCFYDDLHCACLLYNTGICLLFYGGLCAEKNVCNTMMACVAIMGLSVLL